MSNDIEYFYSFYNLKTKKIFDEPYNNDLIYKKYDKVEVVKWDSGNEINEQNYLEMFQNPEFLNLVKINENNEFNKCSICKSCENVRGISL
jgi:hypothetical protein